MASPSNRGREVSLRAPHLSVDWQSPQDAFFSNLRTFFHRSEPVHGPVHPHYFQTTIQLFNFPTRALLASVLWHVILIYFPFPAWGTRAEERELAAEPHYQLTWYGMPKDLERLADPSPRPKPSPPEKAEKPLPRRGADAFHPRQTILSAPKVPTHPRQTLIQPAAPPTPPKVLPPLPNIVQWAQPAAPAPPRVNFRVSRPRAQRNRRPTIPTEDLPLPQVPNQERALGDLNIASMEPQAPQARFSMRAMSVPAPGPRNVGGAVGPAPEIGPSAGGGATNGGSGVEQIIALSANPAPPEPVVEVPQGNLLARLSISPQGPRPGAPSGSPGGVDGGGGGSGGTGDGSGAAGPPGISITGGSPSNTSPIAGLGGTAPPPPPPRSLPAAPLPAKPEPRVMPGITSRIPRGGPGFERIKPGAAPEEILGPKRIYTLHVNMPNLTSATGSWILRFTELDHEGDGATDLAGPVPIRKVDPKYPPALASAKVEGEVVLYAIIRKDGTVDSIQLVRSVDPQLDENAIAALARWKFRPAERHGQPVELEAVIHIPFHPISTSPF